MKSRPTQRPHAEQRDELRRHLGSVDPERLAAPGELERDVHERRDTVERLLVALEIEEVRRREGGLVAEALVQGHETLGCFEPQRPDERRVDDAEGRGVDADAEPEGQDHDGRERGVPAQRAERVAEVLAQGVERRRDPDGAHVLPHPHDVAEREQSLAPRLLRRHALFDVVLGLALDVVADVLVELVEGTLARRHRVHSCGAGRRMRVIAPASLSHRLVSTASCRRPLAVKR